MTCSKASYDTPYAGTGKTVTLSGMRPSNANYTMQESSMTWDRGEIAPGIPNVKQNIQLIQGERIDPGHPGPRRGGGGRDLSILR